MIQDIILTIDSGTTNTRVFVIRGEHIMGKGYANVGVRNTAITGSITELQKGIKTAIGEALQSAKVQMSQIDFVVASGMITSELGLVNLPHLSTPVSLKKLALKVKKVIIPDILAQPIHFIPGVKNNLKNLSMDNLNQADFMRGEEVQVFGALDVLGLKGPVIIIILSSHTKIIGINENNEITGSITTMSGQLFSAVKERTFLASSLPKENEMASCKSDIDKAMILKGFEYATNFGLTRSLLMIRFMEILMRTTAVQRLYFLNGIIAAQDMYSIKQFFDFSGLNSCNTYLLLGNRTRCEMYRELLIEKEKIRGKIIVGNKELVEQATAVGSYKIIEEFRNIASR